MECPWKITQTPNIAPYLNMYAECEATKMSSSCEVHCYLLFTSWTGLFL